MREFFFNSFQSVFRAVVTSGVFHLLNKILLLRRFIAFDLSVIEYLHLHLLHHPLLINAFTLTIASHRVKEALVYSAVHSPRLLSTILKANPFILTSNTCSFSIIDTLRKAIRQK